MRVYIILRLIPSLPEVLFLHHNYLTVPILIFRQVNMLPRDQIYDMAILLALTSGKYHGELRSLEERGDIVAENIIQILDLDL